MIPAAARDVDDLAGALLARAATALPHLDARGRATAAEALERFLARPSPSAFLDAVRSLSRAAREAAMDRLDGEGGRRAFADAVAALRTVGGVQEPVVDRLAGTLYPTRSEGRRLEALASLLAAWRELSGRVSEDTERLRQALRAAGQRPRRRPS